MADDDILPSGYAMYRTDPSDSFALKMLLPTPLKNALYEQRRRDALAAEARSEAEQSVRATPAPAPSVWTTQCSQQALLAKFDREILDRKRTRFHVVLQGDELLRVAARVVTLRDRDYQKRELEVLDKLKKLGPLREIVNPGFAPKGWRQSLAYLRHAYPHFQSVTDFVAGQVALSVRSKNPLSIPPIHLWGAPGLGKTHYANDLARALGCPLRRQSMENAQTSALLLGTERHWSTATFGVVFDQILLGNFANPIFLIDELDKAPRNTQYDPLAPLHSLLEPSTAVAVRDAAMDITFDASLAIFVATSNDPGKVPESLLSRFREFQIQSPNGEQALRAARVISNSAISQLGIVGFKEPDFRIIKELAHLTAREITHAIRDAAARALQDGRLHLTLSDLAADTCESDVPRRLVH